MRPASWHCGYAVTCTNSCRGGFLPSSRRALPKGLTEDQKLNLAQAAKRLDELTASTIHGFCQDVITSYAVEADLDPGAKVVDAADADGIFDAAFSTWLIDRLSQSDDASDPILVLSKSDPLKFVDMLKDLASLKRRHPTATVVPMRAGARADIEFADAVDDFARWAARTKRDAKTESVVTDLRQLADFFRDCFAAPPDFSRLWQLAHPPRVGAMKNKLNDLAPYRRKTAWKELYGPEDGERISAEAEAHFDRAESAYRSLLGQVANGLVGPLSAVLDEVVADYNSRKRAAAALDFDDLLLRAHELVHRNEAVRQALGLRYRHIFVDEFQDTDPIQAAFIFQIAAEQRADQLAGRPRQTGRPLSRGRSEAGDLPLPRSRHPRVHGGAQSDGGAAGRQGHSGDRELPITEGTARSRERLLRTRAVGRDAAGIRQAHAHHRGSGRRSARGGEGHDRSAARSEFGNAAGGRGGGGCGHLRAPHRLRGRRAGGRKPIAPRTPATSRSSRRRAPSCGATNGRLSSRDFRSLRKPDRRCSSARRRRTSSP